MAIDMLIRKKWDKFSLDINFKSQSKRIGILGASGCGKSMTLKSIAGIETPDSGHIKIDGNILFDKETKTNLKTQKRKVGYLFQNYALFPTMTVEQNIAAGLKGNKQDIHKRVKEMIQKFGLAGLEKHYPNQLSGGEQQRVAIARALVNDPQLIIADEPTGNIDPELSYEIVDLLKGINECGTTILMVTHEHDLVRHFGGRIINIDAGEIVFDEVIGGNNEA